MERAKSATRPCPQCGRPVAWGPAAAFRPFCSERCRAIDLGAWLTEAYRVPAEDADDPESSGEDRREST
ncbi:MAG: DNA gyrase inhibitor YacG [Burkholderiales bacterium]|nr:DNA gyrase inhibitor YacG [Burkholderiales bacterium]MCE7876382.1 DNA gyrase inhibitor YacG [Betaproteobacteria bacterium PRO3]